MPTYEMTFGDYARVVVRRGWTVALTMVAVTLAVYWWAERQPARFESRARLKIQRLQTFAQMFEELLVSSGDPLENYVYEIAGHGVTARAAGELRAAGRGDASGNLGAAIRAERIAGTDLIDVFAQGPAADTARERCDAVVRAFIRTHEETVTRNAREEHEDVQRLLEETTRSLADLDAQLRERLGRQRAPADRDEAAALMDKVVEARARLQTLRREGNYTEEYPEIAGLKDLIAAREEQLRSLTELDEQTRAALAEYEHKRSTLWEMVSFLTKRREEARLAQTRKAERVVVVDAATDGQRLSMPVLYLAGVGLLLGTLLGVALAFVAENLDTSIRTLVEFEETFRLSILGIIPHFSPYSHGRPLVAEGLWDRIRYSDLMHSLTVFWRAALSLVPARRAKKAPAPSVLVVPFYPRSPVSEGFRAVRTQLQLAVGEDKPGSILVTSAGPAEGKSTVAANLAVTFAQAGKRVLLVGANMRRPSLYRTFGLNREKGLADILTGETTWREALRDHRDLALGDKSEQDLAIQPGMENLCLVTAGGRTVHPSEWLSLPAFEAVVREWEAEFDVVLLDGPPILPVPDSVIMSAVVRRTVLVYQVGVTLRDSMFRAVSLLKKAGATVAGLVLNDLEAGRSFGPDALYYRGYYGRAER